MPAAGRRGLALAFALTAAAAGLGPPPFGASPQGRAGGRPPSTAEREEPFVAPSPVTCEGFAAIMDDALVEWRNTGGGTYFIVVARPGAGERAGLGRSRLREVETYLGRRSRRDRNYVVAEAGRTRGAGRVEVYVAGRLKAAIPLKKNDRRVCSGRVNPFL